jgi:hypothetical protein
MMGGTKCKYWYLFFRMFSLAKFDFTKKKRKILMSSKAGAKCRYA